MKRSEIRDFIEGGVAAIQPSVTFGAGLLTDFNSKRDNVYPRVWLETLTNESDVDLSSPTDIWPISLYIASIDKMDSSPDEYEDLVDSADFIAQKLTYQYRVIISGYKSLQMGTIKRDPWVKQNADCLTGIKMSFTLKGPDQTDVCP